MGAVDSINFAFLWRGEEEEGGGKIKLRKLSFELLLLEGVGVGVAFGLLLIQMPRPSWKTLEFGRSRRRQVWNIRGILP